MTTVDFGLDEASLAEDLQLSPESANPAALEETYFVMPVRLCMKDVELFEQPNSAKRTVLFGATNQSVQKIHLFNEASCWLSLPLLGFATHALRALNQMKLGDEKKLYLAGGGDLMLTRDGDKLFVESSINGKSSSTEFAEAVNAFGAFSEKIRQLLVSRVPEIQQHPSWRKWFF